MNDAPLSLDPSEAWPAPAKLNLFLHVLGRRADGYHELQTVFQFLDIGDRLHFSLREDDRLCRQGGVAGLSEQEDLVIRAAEALRAAAGRELPGVDIQVDKRLPTQAGLGGGSSDAATTLHALNRLWGLDLDDQALARIGGPLGADVPVFIGGEAAWAEGTGERLQAVELPEPWFVVLRPDCAVSTGELFAAPELRRDSPPIGLEAFLAGAGRNDFEPVVARRYPPVAEALEWLSRHGRARLTGTGACVFAPMADEAMARRVLAECPSHWQAFVARGCNRSPLKARLALAASAP